MSTHRICDICGKGFNHGHRGQWTTLKRRKGLIREHVIDGWPSPFGGKSLIDLHDSCYKKLFEIARFHVIEGDE